MTSRRNIKKDINNVLINVIEECYSEILSSPEKNETKINTIIDEAVDLADDLIAKVNNSKNLKTRKEVKASFQFISTELEHKAVDFMKKLNKI